MYEVIGDSRLGQYRLGNRQRHSIVAFCSLVVAGLVILALMAGRPDAEGGDSIKADRLLADVDGDDRAVAEGSRDRELEAGGGSQRSSSGTLTIFGDGISSPQRPRSPAGPTTVAATTGPTTTVASTTSVETTIDTDTTESTVDETTVTSIPEPDPDPTEPTTTTIPDPDPSITKPTITLPTITLPTITLPDPTWITIPDSLPPITRPRPRPRPTISLPFPDQAVTIR